MNSINSSANKSSLVLIRLAYPLITCLAVSLLACGGWPLFSRQLPVAPTPAAPPLETPTSPIPPTPTLLPWLVTPEGTAIIPTSTAPPPTTSTTQESLVPTLPATADAKAAVQPTVSGPAIDLDGSIYTGPLTDTISLLDPAPGITLPPDLDQLEFKWSWSGGNRPCQLPAGYGFELRLWPHPANPQLPEALRPAVQPLGVIDAVEAQAQIAASCDPQSGARRFLVNHLKNAPGIRMAGGTGHFFWDIAYVQLEPYYVPLAVSLPRDFFIPTPAEMTPPPPVSTPTSVFPLLTPQPAGQNTLVAPHHQATFPVNAGPVEFVWHWEDQAGDGPCSLAAKGYGFELRIWSRQPDFVPLGVMDVVESQQDIRCNLDTGQYHYLLPDLKQAPGVKATYVGEYRWDGQFLWDIALVSLMPYRPPEWAAPPRAFEISLANYSGPMDRFGRRLRCSEIASWLEAQAIYLALAPDQGSLDLDPDGNQIACDELRN
jgi:hypothetical protein